MSAKEMSHIKQRSDLRPEKSMPWLVASTDIPSFQHEPLVSNKLMFHLSKSYNLNFTSKIATFLPFCPDLNSLAPVKNQGENSKACTSYAIAAALEDRLLLGTPSIELPISPLYAHFCIAGKPINSGWDPKESMRALKTAALARETAFDREQLPAQCEARSGVVRLSNISPVNGDADARNRLLLGPVIAVMELYEDFQSKDYRGELYRHQSGRFGGYHTVEVVGYDSMGWVVKNSFGPEWGDQGFGRVAFGECRLFKHYSFSFQPELV